jgi:lysophospholipase L1-like esterase
MSEPVTPEPIPGRNPLLGFFAIVSLPLLLLLDTSLALGRGWRLISRLNQGVMGLVGLSLGLALLGLTRRGGRAFFRRRWAQLTLLTITTATALLAVEGGVWAYFGGRTPGQAPFHGWPPQMKRVFQPDPTVMPGLSAESRFTTNSVGVRGPELPGDRRSAYRLLCLGGSTTECAYLDDDKTWPHLLRVALNSKQSKRPVWVGNTGVGGTASTEHLRFVHVSELLSEVDCLLVLVGINDLGRDLMGVASEEVSEEAGPVWSRSRILGMVRALWYTELKSRTVVQDPNGLWLLAERAQRQHATITQQLPDAERALGAYARRIRGLIERCRAMGVRPVIASQPVLWDKELSEGAKRLLWFGWMADGKYAAVDKLRERMDRYNAVLQNVCAELGVEFIDLSSLSGRQELFYDDCHFTEAGARAVAERIAEHFQR